MSLIEPLNLIISVLFFAISSGIVFSFSLLWDSRPVSILLLGLGGSSCVLALNGMASVLQEPDFAWSNLNAIRVSISLLAVIAGIYFYLGLNVINRLSRINGRSKYVVSLVVLVVVVLVGAGGGAQSIGQPARIELHLMLIVSIMMLVVILLTTVWYAFDVGDKPGQYFSMAGIMLICALAFVVFVPNRGLMLEIGFAGMVNLLVGWPLARVQLLKPVAAVRDELAQRRRDTGYIVAELAAVKKDREDLTGSLELATQYRNEFLSNMSHELRTPLNSIIGYSELLRDQTYGEVNEKQSERLDRIHRNGYQLLDIITNILDLSQIDGGKLDLQVAAFRLADVIEEVVAKFRGTCQEKGIECRIELPDELPHVFGDRVRIMRLIENIIDNAVKFTDSGEIRVAADGISVISGRCDGFPLPTIGWLRDGDWILLRIADTGIGITPEDQARIFEEFTQVDAGGTRAHGGTGVGLAIAKKLVELHSGTIWVKSQLGKGSEFFVALPSEFQV